MLGFSFYQLAMFFIIYSVMGWCLEVIYYTVETGKFVNRGFLNGPVCPIYGFGFTLVIILLTPIKSNLVILFVGSCLVTTALELVTGFALEKIFHAHWWDYSDEKFNFKGYICLKFSLLWGCACSFALLIIHTPVQSLVNRLPKTAGIVFICVCGTVYIADLAVTVLSICSITKELKVTRELSCEIHKLSDKIGAQLSDKTMNVLEKTEGSRAKLEELSEESKQKRRESREKRNAQWQETKAEYERLKVKYTELMRKRSGMNKRRLTKAFPKLSLDSSGDIKSLAAKIKLRFEEAEKSEQNDEED